MIMSIQKPRVVFPFVEAGFGHIMAERSIADAFEKNTANISKWFVPISLRNREVNLCRSMKKGFAKK